MATGGWSSQLRANVLVHKQETENILGMMGVFEDFRAHPQRHSSFNKATPPNPSQTVPPIRNQAFKHVSLWGTFSFEPSHRDSTSCMLSK